MVLNSIQRAAIIAVRREEKKAERIGWLTRDICGAMRAICRREPKSAERMLCQIIPGRTIQDAAQYMQRRGSAAGLTDAEIEAGLREYFGLSEPVAEEGQDELV